MKPLLYSSFYIVSLLSIDCGFLSLILVLPAIFALVIVLGHSSRPKLVEPPQTSFVVTAPSGAIVEEIANGANGTNSVPRRQRSLRERAGIDGRLGKLNNPQTALSDHSTHLAPSPSVSELANVELSRPVRKIDFAEHVRFMSRDSDAKFIEEYQDLSKVGRGQSCSAADLPYNRAKNRFANILPYDHSRVKLEPVDGVDGSDYINASYVRGNNSSKEYIATQGPLLSTRGDFWRMVWEQDAIAIVNLTRCLEKGREKCDQYWPNGNDSVRYGNVLVSLINETPLTFGTIREFKVSLNDSTRVVYHFHFTSFPDFGVPEHPQTLVKFVRAFRARISPADSSSKPIIVHCSAGVGRSGTMIAIDRILQQLRDHDCVDVYGVVYEMRTERFWMVQTEQQYIFVHNCILCILEGREDDDFSGVGINSNSPVVESNALPFGQ